MNEVLKHKIQIINDERIKYEDYYKIFNTLRTVIALAVCPLLEMFEIFIITHETVSLPLTKKTPAEVALSYKIPIFLILTSSENIENEGILFEAG